MSRPIFRARSFSRSWFIFPLIAERRMLNVLPRFISSRRPDKLLHDLKSRERYTCDRSKGEYLYLQYSAYNYDLQHLAVKSHFRATQNIVLILNFQDITSNSWASKWNIFNDLDEVMTPVMVTFDSPNALLLSPALTKSLKYPHCIYIYIHISSADLHNRQRCW